MYISYFITPSCTQKAQLKKQEITPQKYKKKKKPQKILTQL